MKTVCLLLLFILLQFSGCVMPEYPNAEITSSMDFVPIEDYSAKIKTVLIDNGDEISTRGVCWSETPNPLLPNGFLTKDGASPGEFTSTLTDLKPSTRYYVRGYAITPLGIVYSNELSFTTAPQRLCLC